VRGAVDHRVLVRAGRELEHRLEPGGQAEQAAAGQVLGDERREPLAAGAVAGARPADRTVVLVVGEEPGERELADRVRRPAEHAALRDDVVQEPRRDRAPREPDAGRQRLARRPRVHDVVGVERLQRPDRAAVVPELAVVVVLDDRRTRPRGPRDERAAARGGQGHARGELVGRGEQDDVHRALAAERVEQRDVRAAVVHGERGDLETGRGEHRAVGRVPVLLDGGAPGAARDERPGDEGEQVGEPVRDDDPVGVGPDPPGAAEVGGERDPQRLRTPWVAVAERGVRRVRERASRGGEPRAAGEGRRVGHAGPQVERQAWPTGGGRGGRRADDTAPDPRPGADAGLQPALRGELGVRVGDRAARDAEVRGERARRRQARAGDEAAVEHRRAQGVLERPRGTRRREREVEVEGTGERRIGPCFSHDIAL